MKINEFKKPKQIDEGMADNLFGAYNVPEKLRSMFSGQAAVANPAKAQKIFINDFYSKIKLALDNAVKGGLVNPSITQFIQPQPNHPAPKPAPSPAPAPNTKPQTTPNASPATPAPVPPKAPKPAGPTSAQQTVDAARQHRQEIAKAQQVQAAGKAAAAKPGFQRTAADRIAMKAAGLSEDAYDRLNTIFESIMEAGEEPQQQGIYQFVRNWYADYMGNLNWKAHEPQINKLLQNVQTSYKTDGGKAALSQLAQATYSLASGPAAGRNGSRPSYADNEYASPQQSIQNLPPEQIKKAMVSLHNRNPYEYNQIKKTLPE
jgi:hypothetical protein